MIRAIILTFVLLGVWAAAEVIGMLLGLVLFPGAVFLLIYYGTKSYDTGTATEISDFPSPPISQYGGIHEDAKRSAQRASEVFRERNREVRRVFTEAKK